MVTSWHDYPAALLGTTEGRLLDWLFAAIAPGETWLDVGAHYGYTAIAMSHQVGRQGRVFAFEPMLTTAGHLYTTRSIGSLSNLYVVPFALGNPEHHLEIQHLPSTRGMIDSSVVGALSEMLVVAHFDSIWPGLAGPNRRIDGVKIDVQGMEIDVVRGMANTLAEQRPKLVIELHRGVDRQTILKLLTDIGYTNPATPVEPAPGETRPQYHDDRSYAFTPSSRPAGVPTAVT